MTSMLAQGGQELDAPHGSIAQVVVSNQTLGQVHATTVGRIHIAGAAKVAQMVLQSRTFARSVVTA